MSHSYSYKTLKSSYPYFTLQQKLENVDESLKEIVQNYIQLIIDMHSAQNSDIIKSNTSYALRLRESEIKNKQLQSENIELRMIIAQLRAKIEKLRCQRAKTNDSFKESVKFASDKIISLVQQLQCATDSLNTIADPESARGSSFISDGSSVDLATGGPYATNGIQYSELTTDKDTTTEMFMHKKKPVNSIPKALVPINELQEEQKNSEFSISPSSSRRPELVEEESFSLRSEISETFQRVQQQNDKGDNNLQIQGKVFNLEALFVKKELGETDYALRQLEQESKSPCMFQRANGTSSSKTTLYKSHTITGNERKFTADQLQKVETATFQQSVFSPMTVHDEHSVISMARTERSSQDNFQHMEGHLQNMERPEKYNKKCIRGLIKVNGGESRGRKRPQINYAEPNLRSKLRKGDLHTYTLEIDSRK